MAIQTTAATQIIKNVINVSTIFLLPLDGHSDYDTKYNCSIEQQPETSAELFEEMACHSNCKNRLAEVGDGLGQQFPALDS